MLIKKLWITRHVLDGQGITVRENVKIRQITDDEVLVVNTGDSTPGYESEYYYKGEWYLDERSAVERAEFLIRSKLASVEKTRDALMRMLGELQAGGGIIK